MNDMNDTLDNNVAENAQPQFRPVEDHGKPYWQMDIPAGLEWLAMIECSHPAADLPNGLTVRINRDALLRSLLVCRHLPRIESIGMTAEIQCGNLNLLTGLGTLTVYPRKGGSLVVELVFHTAEMDQYCMTLDTEFPAEIRELLQPGPLDPQYAALADLLWLLGNQWPEDRDFGVIVSGWANADLDWLFARHRATIHQWLAQRDISIMEFVDFRQADVLEQPLMLVREATTAWATALLNETFRVSTGDVAF